MKNPSRMNPSDFYEKSQRINDAVKDLFGMTVIQIIITMMVYRGFVSCDVLQFTGLDESDICNELLELPPTALVVLCRREQLNAEERA